MVYDIEASKEMKAYIAEAIKASEQRTKEEMGNLKLAIELSIERIRDRDGKK